MNDETKTKKELIKELQQIRGQVAKLKKSEQEAEKAESRLRESEARFKALAELLPEIVCETDEKGKLTYANRIAYNKFGYTEEEFNQGMNVFQVVIPEDRDRARANMDRIISGEELGETEYMALRKDGSTFPISIYSNAIIRQEKPVGFRTIVVDNTRGKEVEVELRQNENRYRALFGNMGDGVAIYKAINSGDDFIFVDLNKVVEKIENIQRKDVIGKSVLQIFPGIKEFGLFEVFQRVWATGKAAQHPVSQYKDERIIGWRENYVYKLPSDEIVAVYRDVTEQKKAEEELALRAEMLNQSRDGFMVHDLSGNFIYANDTVLKERGYTREEFLKINVSDLVTARHYSEMKRWWQDSTDKKDRTEEVDIYRKDGTCFPVEVNMVKANLGEQKYILCTTRDITERKKAEKEIRVNQQELEMLLDQLPGMVFYKDSNFRYRRVNPTFTKLHKTTRGEIIGKTIGEASLLNAELAEIDDRELMKRGHYISRIIEFPDAVVGSRWQKITKVPIRDESGKIYGILGVGVDISDVIKAEEERELWAEMLDKASDAIILRKIGGNFIYANKTALKQRGYTLKQFTNLSPYNLLISEDATEITKQERLLKAKGQTDWERWVKCQNGSLLPVEAKATLVNFRGQEYTLIIARDITERRKTEDKLKLRAEMLDRASSGIMLSDLEGNFMYVNEAALRDRGYSRKKFLTMNVQNLIEPWKPQVFRDIWKKVLEKGYFRGEFEVARSNGTRMPVEATLTKIRLGEKEYVISVAQDITERRKSEEELKLRAEMLDQTGDAIMLQGTDGNFVYANQTALKERGYSRDEFLKRRGKDTVVAADREIRDKWWLEIQKLGRSESMFNIIRKDGTSFPVETVGTLLNRGMEKYVLAVSRNITERKRMEAERAELERKAHMASRLASVGEMASGIAHEINNPLTGVIGFAQLLSRRKNLPEDVKDKLRLIQEGGQRVASIVKRLLTFARQSKLERTYININDILKSTLKMMSYALETSNITVATQLEPGLPYTMVDAGQLQQVFLNIVVNAEQEMEKAHGSGHLEVKTELVDDSIRISFKDNGPGIAKENLDKVFDPFFTTKEVGAGTGLGLSLSHGIIAEHGGSLYVESKEWKGATFVVELPVTTEGRQYELAEDDTVEKEEVVRGRILVVDDEELIGSYLEQLLGEEGHQVDVETDARKALKRLAKGRYDIILMDIKMPGMGGIEFYRKVKKRKGSLDEKVVFITGDVIGKNTHDFILKTGLLYVTKPFDTDRLLWVVNKVLSGSEGIK